jgi:hypothetical protein
MYRRVLDRHRDTHLPRNRLSDGSQYATHGLQRKAKITNLSAPVIKKYVELTAVAANASIGTGTSRLMLPLLSRHVGN